MNKLSQVGDICVGLNLSPSLPSKVEGANSIPFLKGVNYAMPPNPISGEGSQGQFLGEVGLDYSKRWNVAKGGLLTCFH